MHLIKIGNFGVLGLIIPGFKILHTDAGYVFFFCNSANPFLPSRTTYKCILLNKIALELVRYLEQYYFFFSQESDLQESAAENTRLTVQVSDLQHRLQDLEQVSVCFRS